MHSFVPVHPSNEGILIIQHFGGVAKNTGQAGSKEGASNCQHVGGNISRCSRFGVAV